MSGLNTDAMVDGIVSNALQLGLFDQVNLHEPKRSPGAGMTAYVFPDRIQPYSAASGLNATTVVIVFIFRIYQNMLSEPQDNIDPNLIKAVDILMMQYSQEFTLAGQVRNIDLLGEFGTALSANAGYVNLDGKIFRIMDVNIPVIINDAFSQEA